MGTRLHNVLFVVVHESLVETVLYQELNRVCLISNLEFYLVVEPDLVVVHVGVYKSANILRHPRHLSLVLQDQCRIIEPILFFFFKSEIL